MSDLLTSTRPLAASTAQAATRIPGISVQGLHVAYREGERTFPALAGLDLTLRPGEFVVVTGGNGAGKTTLCRVLAGFVPEFFDADVRGRVDFDDRPMLSIGATDRVGLVGYVFDVPHDQLTGAARTVREEVAFGLENLSVARDEMLARVDDALRLVRIEHLADRHPWSLSGGQTQRLALASVLALRPGILVLDEPTSQLDPLGTQEVVETVRRLSLAGLTIVYVTHSLEPVLTAADRIIVLDAGRVSLDAPVREAMGHLSRNPGAVQVPASVEVGHALFSSVELDSAPITAEECIETLRETGVALVDEEDALDATTGYPTSPSRADDPMISLEHVSFTYPNGTEALRDVSLVIAGGCVCVVGQNGSGKSTLMRHLNGLLRPSEGIVRVGGRDARDRPVHDLARAVGVAFQNPDDQLFSRTVRDEIAFGARSVGLPEDEITARVAEAIDALELTDSADRRPLELGYAARKRIIAASIVAMGCAVVVLDEPTSAQDGLGVQAIERTVRDLVASGRTAIVVSHDMEFVARIADRVVVMHDGGVLLDGAPGTVLAQAERLAETSVQPPAAARVGIGLGLRRPPLQVDELVARVLASSTTDSSRHAGPDS